MPPPFEYSALVNSHMHEHTVEGTFFAKELDVIYISAPNGNEFRAQFSFEWEMIRSGDDNSTIEMEDKFGVPNDVLANCSINHFHLPAADKFLADQQTAYHPDRALELFNMLSMSLEQFQTFLESYTDYCDIDQMPDLSCELFRFDDDASIQEITGKI